MKIPRIVIAGTNSGCGKTTITSGIMAALTKRGLTVQPYKVGPDYIDPMFHTRITGRYSRNLDSWMLDEQVVKYLFAKNTSGADIAVIEGVMGMYDGFGARSKVGSTAHVSTILEAPVILVLNVQGMSLSAAAMVDGFRRFDNRVDIQGVILNNISSEAHYSLMKDIIESNAGLRVVGYLPRSNKYALESRHLGLVTSSEVENLNGKLDALVEQVEKTLDLSLLLEIAQQAEEFAAVPNPLTALPVCESGEKGFKIAVAMDKAFNFYYRDNLELLETLGAELKFFSPLEDTALPDGVKGLYIGGGYPEVWARKLAENSSMQNSIREQIQKGLPTYAECGGFMYLTESIRDREGNCHSMVGVIPGGCEMTSSLKRFGYVEVEALEESVICKPGYKIRAHEFHYSTAQIPETVSSCYRVVKKREGRPDTTWACGYKAHQVMAGYPHLHFCSNPEFAVEFVRSCCRYI